VKRIIGIIGPIAAGKDTAADYIADTLHVPSFQISAPLKMICAERGIEPIRQNLISLGTSLAKEKGEAYLAEYLLGKVDEDAVITGLRQLAQINYLRSHSDLTLVSIDAEAEVRFKRAAANEKLGEAKTLEEFIEREVAENSAPNVQRLFECMELADIRLLNNGDLKMLFDNLNDKVIDSFGLSS
jgi:dephospho-CoA kinase